MLQVRKLSIRLVSCRMEALPIPDEQGPGLPLGIAAIHVRDLHGKFDYDVDFLDPSTGFEESIGKMFAVNDDRLTLLYGRNGSGKTSLLRLLFHAISAAPGSGHRSALGRTRFRSFEVKLTDRSAIAYVRPAEKPPFGPCIASIRRPGLEPVTWEMMTEDDGRVPALNQQLRVFSEDELRMETLRPEPYASFLNGLQALDLNPVLLGDSRRITSDVVEEESEESQRGRESRQSEDLRRAHDVMSAIERARRYLGQVAFAGTQAGSSRVESVYLGVTTAISQHSGDLEPQAGLLPELVNRVRNIGSEASVLHQYGLMPDFDAEKLATQLGDASEQNARLLKQVLDPYLEGLEQRIEALQPGLNAVSAYIDALNDFLEGKRAEFHLGPEGVVINDEITGERLAPQKLSSGEKQIVLLFSDIVALQKNTRVFIIDEPELSLNPEWQRHLMPRLLGVTEQSRMQLIAATHSIEIMAQYRDRIRRLAE